MSIGGVAGYSGECSITNCNVDISINLNDVQHDENTESADKANFMMGGLIGGSVGTTIKDNQVEITLEISNSNQYIRTGGMVGRYLNNNSEHDVEIENCEVDVIISSDDNNMYAGGFVSLLEARGAAEVKVLNCTVKNEITSPRVGGFMYCCNGDEQITIQDCISDNDITAYLEAAGFIYRVDDVTITNCHSIGNIFATRVSETGGSGAYAAGFCERVNGSELNNCYFSGNVNSYVASGFIAYALKSVVIECFSGGQVIAGLSGAGFVDTIANSVVNNCFSTSDITITNTDPDNPGRTLVGGFIEAVISSTISNCHYTGSVKGKVYSVGQFGIGYIVGAFIGYVRNSDITECYIVHKDKDFAPDIIGRVEKQSPEAIIDVVVYEDNDEIDQ